MEKQFARKKDIWIILILLAAALALWLLMSGGKQDSADSGPYAEIYYYGDVVQTIALGGEAKTFSIPQAPQIVFERKDGAIAFVQSDCPDQVCVHSGRLTKGGHFAACLPNGVTLWVADGGPEEDTVDTIVK